MRLPKDVRVVMAISRQQAEAHARSVDPNLYKKAQQALDELNAALAALAAVRAAKGQDANA